MHLSRRRSFLLTVLLAVSLPASAALSAAARQDTKPAAARLTVAGDVTTPLELSAADIKTMPRTTVTLKQDGRDVKYEGVLVAEILKRAGVPLGHDLSGPAVATYVLATAGDGYQAVFSLAELDPAFTSNDIIVADSIDGKPLFDYQGPFRIVAPLDKRGARGVRMLQTLNVVRLRK